MNNFQLSILASDRPFYEGECVSLLVPTNDGIYGVQAHHHNIIAAIVAGTLSFKRAENSDFEYAAVSEGIMKVEDNKVLILVDTAERPDEIDSKRAMLDAEEAKEEMLKNRSIAEYKEAQARLARALTRLKTKGKMRIN